MKCIKETVRLLKKHGRFSWVIWHLALMATVVALGLIFKSGVLVTFSTIYPIMVFWDMSEVYHYEERDRLKGSLADAQDKLCLAEHKAERLAVELDVVQTAFRVCERRREEQEARMKEQAGEAMPAAAETVASEAPKPERKRRPAPRRKPMDGNANGNRG